MDKTDKLIETAVSQYAPSDSVKKHVFEKIMKKVEADNAYISVVYVSRDAEKLLNKIYSKTNGVFKKLSKVQNEIFKEINEHSYWKQ